MSLLMEPKKCIVGRDRGKAKEGNQSEVYAEIIFELAEGAMADSPKITVRITDPALWERIQEHTTAKGLDYSEFLRGCVELYFSQDISKLRPLDDSVLVDLAQMFCGPVDAQEMAELTKGEDQPKLLRDMIRDQMLELKGAPEIDALLDEAERQMND